ncbi:ABC transporter ATP-binding protein [Streptomyces sp. SP18CS02]|uniref:ABC transporter ATP-binding protein n=1 Tax=Streptomyces sp. SP18CS02 TaxID=3002531 RepID=UPI002E77DF3C|nr:ABC transporter ATP-binding protein [Streptomyces sp. SP18CS02]MEE1755533.1 ABC transporter ATP-binding protein [Streptomyces sp. SP18CS02]
MIRAYELTKRYGDKTVVEGLSFSVRPGTVTGFLGPNGAGKSTTLRMLLGLDTPTRGRSTIGDRAYATHPAPLTEVGALLEARSIHPGRTAFHHLMALAHTHGIPRSRVTHVLALAGLTEVAHKRVKGFSLGMGQRLGIAAALLGDPATVILDEPVNGLDPEGVLWVRDLLRSLAAEGRTVLVSSHLMSEMALTADHLVVIGRGRLLADTTVADLVRDSGAASVRVVAPRAAELRALLLATPGVQVAHPQGTPPEGGPPRAAHRQFPGAIPQDDPHTLEVRGIDAPHIGRLAATHAIELHELTPRTASLEQAFMDLTQTSVEYQAVAYRTASHPTQDRALPTGAPA